jgi:hypothetical protein
MHPAKFPASLKLYPRVLTIPTTWPGFTIKLTSRSYPVAKRVCSVIGSTPLALIGNETDPPAFTEAQKKSYAASAYLLGSCKMNNNCPGERAILVMCVPWLTVSVPGELLPE